MSVPQMWQNFFLRFLGNFKITNQKIPLFFYELFSIAFKSVVLLIFFVWCQIAVSDWALKTWFRNLELRTELLLFAPVLWIWLRLKSTIWKLGFQEVKVLENLFHVQIAWTTKLNVKIFKFGEKNAWPILLYD